MQEYGLEKKFKIYVAMTIQQALANKEDLAIWRLCSSAVSTATTGTSF